MKIALLNTLYAPYESGGAERSTQLLAEGLVRRGHRVCVITLGEPGATGTTVLNGVTVHRVPLDNWYWPYSGSPGNAAARAAWHVRDFRNAAMSSRVGALLDRVAPEVLSTHSLAGFSVGAWNEAGRRGIPVVHTLRDYYLMCPPGAMYRNAANCAEICARCRPFAAYRRHASRSVQAVTGVSRFILERHLSAGFFPHRRKANVIFNATPAAAGAPANSNAPPTFGFIGRLSPEKGLRWLLEAFSAGAPPGSRLLIAGRGEARFVQALKAAYASPSVAFMGQVEPTVFFRQVDVVVAPSLWHEPFGRVVIEALSHGLPVIASSRGGLKEIVEDGTTGLIVDPDDPGSLGRAIARFCAAPGLASRLRSRCAEQRTRFSAESVTAAYEEVLMGLASVPVSAVTGRA